MAKRTGPITIVGLSIIMTPGKIRTVRMSHADAIEYVEYHDWVVGLLPTTKHGLVTMPKALHSTRAYRERTHDRFQVYSQMRFFENGKHYENVHAHYRVVVAEAKMVGGRVVRPHNDINLKRSTKRVFYKSRFMPLEGSGPDEKLSQIYRRAERVVEIMNRMNLTIEAYEITGELQKLFDKLWQEDMQDYDPGITSEEKNSS